jgi:hypothetical protein
MTSIMSDTFDTESSAVYPFLVRKLVSLGPVGVSNRGGGGNSLSHTVPRLVANLTGWLQVEPQMRKDVKELVYGISYGMGPGTLAGKTKMDCSVEKAKKYMADLKDHYPTLVIPPTPLLWRFHRKYTSKSIFSRTQISNREKPPRTRVKFPLTGQSL